MPIETIQFKDKIYPKFQAEGNSAQFIIPTALKICKGIGYDIGCGPLSGVLPGAIPIDPQTVTGNSYHATNLPEDSVDFIFSSHCLEHLDDWVEVLKYWTERIKDGGVLFLYLPHYSQEYWRPWNYGLSGTRNGRHKHAFVTDVLKDALDSMGYGNIFVSGCDANNSFSIFGERR